MNPLLFRLLSEAGDDDKKKDKPANLEDAPGSADLDMSDELNAADDDGGDTPDDNTGDDTGTEDTADDTGGDDVGDDTPADDTGTDDESDGGDDTTEDGTDGDESGDGTEGEEETDNSVLKKKQLLEEISELYTLISTTSNQLTKVDTIGQKETALIRFAQDEIGKLKQTVYDYLIFKFSQDSYEENLVLYYKFETSLKICTQIIAKVNDMRNEK